MENFKGNVEVNSVVDLELEVREDPTDPVTELPHAGTLDNGVDPIWAGLRTDADACQADAPISGHAVKCLSRTGDSQPSSLVRPVWLWHAIPAWSSQRRIQSDTRTLAYKLRHPEPCLWTKVMNAEESWAFRGLVYVVNLG